MSAPSVSALIGAEARRVRGTTRAAAACLALLALPLALVVGFALAGSATWQQPSAAPLVLEVTLLAYAAAVGIAVRNYLRLRAGDAHVRDYVTRESTRCYSSHVLSVAPWEGMSCSESSGRSWRSWAPS